MRRTQRVVLDIDDESSESTPSSLGQSWASFVFEVVSVCRKYSSTLQNRVVVLTV